MESIMNNEQASLEAHQDMLQHIQSLFSDRLSDQYITINRLYHYVYETFYDSLGANDGYSYSKFWAFLKDEEVSTEEYKVIRSYYLNKKLKINTKELDREGITYDAMKKLLTTILFFDVELNEKLFVTDLIEEVLNANTITKYYDAPAENIYTDQYKENLKFWGKSDVLKLTELTEGYRYSDEYEELEGEHIFNPELDYNKVITSNFQNILLIANDELQGTYTTKKIVSNLEVFPVHGANESYIVTFDYDDYNCSYGIIGELCLEIDVTTYPGDEMWEFYLVQSYKNYSSNNFRTAFLLGFVSFESLIETTIYYIKIHLKEFIKKLYCIQYGINEAGEIEKILKDVESDRSHTTSDKVLNWYIRCYKEFCKDQRDLINGKLRDIIRLYLQVEYAITGHVGQVKDFSEKLGDLQNVESVILDKMKALVDTRNELAHGKTTTYSDKEYKKLFEELAITCAHFVSYLKGERLVDTLIKYPE